MEITNTSNITNESIHSESQDSHDAQITTDANIGAKTMAEDFLEAHYEFRRNVLRGVVEYRKVENENSEWQLLTQEAINSICLRGKHEFDSDADLNGDIKLYVQSEEPHPTPTLHPLYTLPYTHALPSK